MPIWQAIGYYIVTLALYAALAPKPPRPRPATLQDFDLPTAEEDRAVPVLFGECAMGGPNVIWYGDLSVAKLKKSNLIGSVTIGYKYSLGLHLACCFGPIDEVTQIEIGDKVAWSGSITASSSASIDEPELFGGKSGEGGVVGTFDVAMGEAAQLANDYLVANVEAPVPAYRGTTAIVWRGGYLGNSQYIKPWRITGRRVLAGWQNDDPWYPAAAEIGRGMNPAHIIVQCLTDPEWGAGHALSRVDDVSFMAAADTLKAEGFGLSLLWTGDGLVDDFINEVLQHIAGVLYFDPYTAKFGLRLFRGDYVPADLDHYTAADIQAVSRLERRAWGETVNEITLGYTDPSTRKTTAVTVHDLANIASQGARLAEQILLPGITSTDLAQTVAMRELAARSTPLASMTLVGLRAFWTKRPGDVFRIDFPARDISEMIVRVLEVRGGTLENGAITLEVIEDIYAQELGVYAVAHPAPAVPSSPALPDDNDTTMTTLISVTENVPPVSGLVDGDRYYVPLEPGGAWVDHEGDIAEWDEDEQAWIFTTPEPGTIFYAEDLAQHFMSTTVLPGGLAPGAVPEPAPWAGEHMEYLDIDAGRIIIDLRLARYFSLLLDQPVTDIEFRGLSQDKVQWWTIRVEYVGSSDQASITIPDDWRFPVADGEYVPTVADGAFDLLHGIRWPDMTGWFVLHKADFL